MVSWQANTPYLLIPVETRVRELHAKLLLSCVAVEAGFSVVLGWPKPIQKYTAYLPRGIIVERSVAVWNVAYFRRFRQLGNHIVSWCEEGLATLHPDFYVRYRVAEEVLGLTDKFFAWGPYQAHTIATRMPNSGHKMVITGNVRFDLLREPYRRLFTNKASELKEHHGPFILINTNFDNYNNYKSRQAAFDRLKKRGVIKNQEDADFFWHWSEHVGEKYRHFVAMVAYLSGAFPHHTIVVRPHPSENFTTWQQHTKSLANVHVVHDGNVVPWLIAAEVVIHNSCTTGIEAYVVGTPVVAYRPIQSDTFDTNLPNEMSKQVTSLPELHATLREVLAQQHAFAHDQQSDPHTRQILHQYVADLEGPFAADQIVSMLRQDAQKNVLKVNGHLNSLRNRIIVKSLGLMNSRWIDAIRLRMKGKTHGEDKFPTISVEEVKEIIADLQRVSGRFERVKVRSVGLKNLFHIQQE